MIMQNGFAKQVLWIDFYQTLSPILTLSAYPYPNSNLTPAHAQNL